MMILEIIGDGGALFRNGSLGCDGSVSDQNLFYDS
jgi:hypothetical protein